MTTGIDHVKCRMSTEKLEQMKVPVDLTGMVFYVKTTAVYHRLCVFKSDRRNYIVPLCHSRNDCVCMCLATIHIGSEEMHLQTKTSLLE